MDSFTGFLYWNNSYEMIYCDQSNASQLQSKIDSVTSKYYDEVLLPKLKESANPMIARFFQNLPNPINDLIASFIDPVVRFDVIIYEPRDWMIDALCKVEKINNLTCDQAMSFEKFKNTRIDSYIIQLHNNQVYDARFNEEMVLNHIGFRSGQDLNQITHFESFVLQVPHLSLRKFDSIDTTRIHGFKGHTLVLTNCGINENDLDFLRNTNIQILDLSENLIRKVDVFENFNGKELNLSMNLISNPESLKNFKGKLNLSKNENLCLNKFKDFKCKHLIVQRLNIYAMDLHFFNSKSFEILDLSNNQILELRDN